MAGWKISGASVGAMLASLLTLGCCLPLPFLGAAGLAGASVILAGARPWLLGISVLLLGAGFFQVYRGIRCRIEAESHSLSPLLSVLCVSSHGWQNNKGTRVRFASRHRWCELV